MRDTGGHYRSEGERVGRLKPGEKLLSATSHLCVFVSGQFHVTDAAFCE